MRIGLGSRQNFRIVHPFACWQTAGMSASDAGGRLLVWTALILRTVGGGAATPPAVFPVVRDIQEEYFHRAWNRENGLPDSEVTAILQTRDGYLWVATPFSLA